jgi:hypothetical protein
MKAESEWKFQRHLLQWEIEHKCVCKGVSECESVCVCVHAHMCTHALYIHTQRNTHTHTSVSCLVYLEHQTSS